MVSNIPVFLILEYDTLGPRRITIHSMVLILGEQSADCPGVSGQLVNNYFDLPVGKINIIIIQP